MLDAGILVLFLASIALANPFPQSSADLATESSFEDRYNDMNPNNADPTQHDSNAQGTSPNIVMAQNADINLATLSYPNADVDSFGLQDTTVINPVPSSNDAQNSIIANQENSPVSSNAIDSNLLNPQGAIVANNHLNDDCFSEGLTNADNDLTQKRDVSSSPPAKVCPNGMANPAPNKKPGWFKIPGWFGNPESEQANPRGRTNQKKNSEQNPCTDKSRKDYDPLHPVFVSCGGPYIGISELYPEHVLNCDPGEVKSIPSRTFFKKSPGTFKYCCVKHHHNPIYYFASFCHQLIDRRPFAASIKGMTRSEFERMKETHLKELADQGIYPNPDPPEDP